MKNLKEKTIVKQVCNNMDFLAKFIVALRQSPQLPIFEFFEDWQKSIGFESSDNYSLVNQGVVLTHLYGLIAFPKAICHSEIPIIKMSSIKKNEWGSPIFLKLPIKLKASDKRILGIESVKTENDLTLEFFIRKIRNSISHSCVEINENMDFVFEDKDGTKIKFDISGIQKFTEKFRYCFITQKWI